MNNLYFSNSQRISKTHPVEFFAEFEIQSRVSRVFFKQNKWAHQSKIMGLWVTESAFEDKDKALERQQMHIEAQTLKALCNQNVA